MKLDFTDWKACFDGFAWLTPLNINIHSALGKKGRGERRKRKSPHSITGFDLYQLGFNSSNIFCVHVFLSIIKF